MEKIGAFPDAVNTVLTDVSKVLADIRRIVQVVPESASTGVAVLSELRDLIYEDLNQIQHEYLNLLAAEWLLSGGLVPTDGEWYWNPRQTGGRYEPDLQARVGDKIVISAEVTTSRKSRGTIKKRMKKTIEKLRDIPGKRFYFVRTEDMASKARTFIRLKRWRITVVCLPHTGTQLEN
jgi:hypothetical protein